ncbi:unnamed protein product [Rhizoctonia solani]|uniref:Uncharacterized protein n=1 Tax=Rhizoctonia solani TaxID=456999 RepID=A0A8H2WWM3_9AGAM|nr:unnamed protein product [Rhizoctonia solani]
MSCRAANPDVIDLGIRLAIYSYAACSATLGFLTLLSTGQRRYIQEPEEANAYTERVVKHVKDVDFAVATSTLTGVALIIAALFHQHYFHTLTLFHAYIVLLLLWVITLTGMWFVIHAWVSVKITLSLLLTQKRASFQVFDILATNRRRMNTFEFWKRILYHSKWFTIHFSLMGGYGLYVTIRRGDFQPPECIPTAFKNHVLSSFVYGFAAVPVLNSCMLFVITSLLVWIASVIVAACSHRGWRGLVDPIVFCFFWLLEYIVIIGGIILTIELQLKENTDDKGSPSPFGSTLAVSLVIVPLQLVGKRAWQMIKPPQSQGQGRYSVAGKYESQPFVYNHESTGGTMSTVHSRGFRLETNEGIREITVATEVDRLLITNKRGPITRTGIIVGCMSEACKAANPDIIDLGARIAIYSYAGCSALLGFLTLVGASQRRQLQAEEDQFEYTEKVVKHINEVNEAVATSTLTGMALIIAALVHQHLFHSLTLFHAYMVLCLLWVVTLTGMWFVIHAWVFDILRAKKRRMATFSFWKRIIIQAKWFTVQFCAMGAYGLYVTVRRDDFLPPECVPGVFSNEVWSIFLYSFATIPVINSCMLFIITSFFVWVASVLVAICSRKGWKGLVDPIVFCIFWLLEYVLLTVALIVMIETQLKENTSNDQTQAPFGSTLAMALVIVPLKVVAVRMWQMLYGDVPPPPATPAPPPPKHLVLIPADSDLSHPPKAYYPKQYPKEYPKGYPKDYWKDYSKDHSKDSSKDQTKDYSKDQTKDYTKDRSKDYAKDRSKDVPRSPMKPRRPHSPPSPTRSNASQQPSSPIKPPSKPPSRDCLRTHRDPSKVPSKESLRPHRPREPFKVPSQDSLQPPQYHSRNPPRSPSKESLREARHRERYLNAQV